jgi:Arc/MetJ family transcription regulator
VRPMRTNIEIDDELMKKAMKSSGAKTKKALVEEALLLLVRIKSQSSIRELRGKIKWEGNLEESRRSRFTD